MAKTSLIKIQRLLRFVPALFLVLIIGLISIIGATPGLAQRGVAISSPTKTTTPTLTPVPSATPRSTASPVPATAPGAATPVTTGVTTDTVELPSSASIVKVDELDMYEGIPVGFTEAGDPFMGDPGAPVTIFEFSDYLCPFCGRHFNDTLPSLIDEYVRTGQLQYVFLDNPIAALHPTAAQGHVAARCVGEQGSVPYWALHNVLFGRQSAWSGLPDPRWFFDTVVESLDVDMDLYNECMESGRQVATVQARNDLGDALGVTGTPTFDFVRNSDGKSFRLVGANPLATYTGWLDALLAGDDPPIVEAPRPELPYWANGEGLAPDPDRPGFTLAGDPFKGSPDAPLTIVEFSDFQCPACATQVVDVQPLVDSELIATDQVRWVFKNFPLRIHPQALAAATAAECAGDQGLFWPMHDLLFARQDEWAVDDVDAALALMAEELNRSLEPELGLDVEVFAACTGSRQALERVLPDLYDGQGVIDSTPTFILLDGERGTLYKGTRNASDFVELAKSFIVDSVSQEGQ